MGDFPDVKQMVRDVSALPRRYFGCADVHAAVELHGVGIDDLTAEYGGKVDREFAFAGRGRPDDRHHASGFLPVGTASHDQTRRRTATIRPRIAASSPGISA